MNNREHYATRYDSGECVMESPPLRAGMWIIDVSIPYHHDLSTAYVRAGLINSEGEPVGPLWNFPINLLTSMLHFKSVVELPSETKLKVVQNGIPVTEATIHYLRLR